MHPIIWNTVVHLHQTETSIHLGPFSIVPVPCLHKTETHPVTCGHSCTLHKTNTQPRVTKKKQTNAEQIILAHQQHTLIPMIPLEWVLGFCGFYCFWRFFFLICQISSIPTSTPAQKLHHLSRLTSAKAGRQQIVRNGEKCLPHADLGRPAWCHHWRRIRWSTGRQRRFPYGCHWQRELPGIHCCTRVPPDEQPWCPLNAIQLSSVSVQISKPTSFLTHALHLMNNQGVHWWLNAILLSVQSSKPTSFLTCSTWWTTKVST